VTAHDIDADLSGSEPEDEFEIRQDPWIKRVLPRTMFGRSLLIVVMPLILLQAIATWVFYDRHWAAVSWRLSAAVAGDIGLLIDALKLADSPFETARSAALRRSPQYCLRPAGLLETSSARQ
jgi:two-component system, OmpR family, osmolarity sensor histidine kinase EnvZ